MLDVVTWTHSTGGVARSLDPALADPYGNDADWAWCDAPADRVYGAGDRGTPGEENPPCP